MMLFPAQSHPRAPPASSSTSNAAGAGLQRRCGAVQKRRPARAVASRAWNDASSSSSSSLLQSVLDQATSAVGGLGSQLPLPESLSQLQATSRELLSNQPPHFGTQQAQRLLQSIALGDGTDVRDRLLSSVPQSLPSITLPSELASASESAAAAASSLSASASSLLRSAAAAASNPSSLGDSAAPLPDLESHFGSRLLQHSLGSVTAWLQAQVSLLQAADPAGAVDEMREALGGLQQAVRMLATLPGISATSAEATQAALSAILQQQAAALSASAPAITAESLLHQLTLLQSTGIGGHSPLVLSLVVAATATAVAVTAPPRAYDGYTALLPFDDHVKLGHEYSGNLVAEYWRRRPVEVATRALGVAAEAAGFGAALLLDLWTGKLEVNQAARARQLRGVIERLGPAYVKVAQALSTRVDLLPPEYFLQIQLLQDRVPPFPCSLAKAAMEEAFGQPIDEVFDSLSERPVAAASLGQVYRAKLEPELGGEDVAVKVLRPGVLEQVALDLYLMREAAAVINSTGSMNTDWVAVIDEWALRFFAEMDYDKEARNAALLKKQMAHLAGIVIADVIPTLSTADVLTTAWVDGEKLSESRASDVRELCNTLLNAYLIQLLDTGFLHADPHPGNLIRTPEGKICILDYGLMTEVTEAQRWALLEYIAHLSTEDWEALAGDLQVMGFIPPEVNPKDAGLVEPLGVIMSQLTGGGGAAKVNIDKVIDELNQLGERYPFQIPPFFALILRAFSVIEGIALKVDPDYAIVKECFPYLSRRLLADDSPRAHAILRDLLYGNKQRLDMERLTRLAAGFGAYTTDGLQESGSVQGQMQGQRLLPAAAGAAGTSSGGAALVGAGSRQLAAARKAAATPAAATPSLDPAVKDALVLLMGRRGSYVQDLLVAEAVAAADALSRSTLSALLQAALASAPAALARSGVAALGPLRSLVLPMPTPLELLSRLSPTLAATPEDQEALNVVRGVLTLMQAATPAAPPPGAESRAAALSAAAAELAPLLPALSPGLSYMSEAFVRAFFQRVMQRAAAAGPDIGAVFASSLPAPLAPVLGFMPGAKAAESAGRQQQRGDGAAGVLSGGAGVPIRGTPSRRQ